MFIKARHQNNLAVVPDSESKNREVKYSLPVGIHAEGPEEPHILGDTEHSEDLLDDSRSPESKNILNKCSSDTD